MTFDSVSNHKMTYPIAMESISKSSNVYDPYQDANDCNDLHKLPS